MFVLRSAVAAVVLSLATVATSQAMEVETYVDVAERTMKTVKRGKAKDVDKLIAMQRELIRLGVEGALEYAEKNPTDAKMMHLVVLNSQRMQNLSLEEMQKEWLDGEYLRAHGVDLEKFSDKDAPVNLYNAVVYPATAVIALEQYKKNKDPALLQRVHDELAQVVSTLPSASK